MKLNELNNRIFLAKKSAEKLLVLKKDARTGLLLDLSKNILKESKNIILANQKDIAEAVLNKKNESFVERLTLNKNRVISMASSVKKIAMQKDNLFEVLERKTRLSGIKIEKVRFPLGLVAVIYESRPNVTVDSFAMAFKSGNSIILKGGKEIQHTNKLIVEIIKKLLENHKIDPDIVQDISGLPQSLSKILMKNKKIDCLIPRGGKKLIEFVQENSRIPIIITGASVVHAYVDESADLELAKRVILNAKTRRVSICNALDVLLIHQKVAANFLLTLSENLQKNNVAIVADKKSFSILDKIGYEKLTKAKKSDFDTEFLDYRLAIKVVADFPEAISHIKIHSLGHSEIIITKSKKQAENFFREIDAACLYWNTSSQFSDGEEFGMGGEIGISTQKLHARGPFAYSELTTYKYLIESAGAIRK